MNINEFADKIGVSRATVWRAINGNGRISPETRELVLRKAEELNLKPSRSAQALRSGQTHLIELWIPHLDSQFSGLIVSRVQSHLSANGFDVIVRGVGNPDELNRSLYRNSPWPVDGILAVDPPDEAVAFLEKNVNPGTPFLSMGCYCLEKRDHVLMDENSGTDQIIRHMIDDVGCKRIVSFADRYCALNNLPRQRVVVEAAREAGVEHDLLVVRHATSVEGLRAMNDYLASHTPPDGVFCYNDSTAIGVQLALSRRGIRVPDDVAVAGFDGIEVADFLPVPLTTVQLPIPEMCAQALELLQNRMSDQSIPLQRAVLKPKLVIRESTAKR